MEALFQTRFKVRVFEEDFTPKKSLKRMKSEFVKESVQRADDFNYIWKISENYKIILEIY